MKLTKIETPPRTRIDTTVGTRVFAGDTMIYGDTGWRDVKGLDAADFSGDLMVRRINNTVHIRLIALSPPEDLVRPTIVRLPSGLRASGRAMLPLTHTNAVGTQARLWIDGAVARVVMGNTSAVDGVYTSSTKLTGINSFVTDDPWPTSLPGTPL